MKTILVVDDDSIQRRLLVEILQPLPYKVLQATDGQQGLSVLKEHPVHLIITDRAMPGMGGLEFLKALKERRVEIPVIMVSAYGEDKLWADAIGLGAQDYLLKPVQTDEVLKFVKKYLGDKKSK